MHKHNYSAAGIISKKLNVICEKKLEKMAINTQNKLFENSILKHHSFDKRRVSTEESTIKNYSDDKIQINHKIEHPKSIHYLSSK